MEWKYLRTCLPLSTPALLSSWIRSARHAQAGNHGNFHHHIQRYFLAIQHAALQIESLLRLKGFMTILWYGLLYVILYVLDFLEPHRNDWWTWLKKVRTLQAFFFTKETARHSIGHRRNNWQIYQWKAKQIIKFLASWKNVPDTMGL